MQHRDLQLHFELQQQHQQSTQQQQLFLEATATVAIATIKPGSSSTSHNIFAKHIMKLSHIVLLLLLPPHPPHIPPFKRSCVFGKTPEETPEKFVYVKMNIFGRCVCAPNFSQLDSFSFCLRFSLRARERVGRN